MDSPVVGTNRFAAPNVRPSAAVIALLLLAGIAISLASGWGFSRMVERRLIERLELAPPLAVVDFATVLEGAPAGTSGVGMRDAVRDLEARARRLGRAGYLVIDGQAVIAAPRDIYVPVRGGTADRPDTVARP
ncbi:MAG: hypothetical protein U9R74_02355 [Pseudomonadota bacterium]|nr:hypothetical protein [Pseudomonadota bacterium]